MQIWCESERMEGLFLKNQTHRWRLPAIEGRDSIPGPYREVWILYSVQSSCCRCDGGSDHKLRTQTTGEKQMLVTFNSETWRVRKQRSSLKVSQPSKPKAASLENGPGCLEKALTVSFG